MDPSQRVVVKMPLSEIWDDHGPIVAHHKRYLRADDIKAMLRLSPVQFIVANVGDPLTVIPLDQCFTFWKSEVQDHLVADPDGPIRLEKLPGEYAYLASEWSGGTSTPIVVLEKLH